MSNDIFINSDLIQIILNFRSINDNIKYSFINKLIQYNSIDIVKKQINVRRFFLKFKKNTIFSRKVKKTYSLKNKYINREEHPILLFL